MGVAINIRNLNCRFKNQSILNDINIEFEENKIYGLLGKNGAGKTTLLNIITNQLLGDSGDIKILGTNIKDNTNILDNVCIVREKEFYNAEMKIKNIFKMYSYFYKEYDFELQKELCAYFNIDTNKRYQHTSRGIKSLISNIIGICSNAKITIFDEPTIGLDAVNREQFYSILLENYMRNPRTIIISTHLIDEMGNLLENIVIMNEGQIIINDSLENIKEKSYYITGDKDDLDKLSCLDNKECYKSFGNIRTYYYYGNLSEDDLDIIEKLNIDIETAKLQEVFVNITKKGDFKYAK